MTANMKILRENWSNINAHMKNRFGHRSGELRVSLRLMNRIALVVFCLVYTSFI